MRAQRWITGVVLALVSLAQVARAGDSPVDQNIFVKLSKKLVPSVVNISTFSNIRPGNPRYRGSPDDLFRRFFEEYMNRGRGPGGPGQEDEEDGEEESPPPGNPQSRGKRAMSLGTGFIIDASGLILTNNHVVADAEEIKISFTENPDEKPTDGEVVGRDPEIDVALIKVKTSTPLAPVQLGDSDNVEVGEYVAAVGNPFGQGHSVTHGIISAKGRSAPDFPLANYFQTDAPINPGNSGGPLVNLKGEVIAINNAIDQRAQGIGFAIPINIVKKILPQLRSKGAVARGYIGILVNEVTPDIAANLNIKKDVRAPLVTQVYPGEPAAVAGIKPYDLILEFNGKVVRTGAELIAAVTSVEVGQEVPVKILSGGQEKNVKIKVSQRPGGPQMAKGPQKPKAESPKAKAPVNTGMSLEDVTPEIARELGMPDKTKGVVVVSTAYDGPADRAGVLRGDLILEVDRKPVTDVAAFYKMVKEKKSYLLRVRRGDPQGHEVFSVIVLDLKEK